MKLTKIILCMAASLTAVSAAADWQWSRLPGKEQRRRMLGFALGCPYLGLD